MDAFALGEYYTTPPSCSTSGYKRSYTPSSSSNALVPYSGSSASSSGGGFYSTFGGLAAGRLGAFAGTYLDNAGGVSGLFKSARNWIGMGDYELRSNSLIRNNGSGDVEIVTHSSRGTRIRFREYIGDVFTHPDEAGKFYAKNYAINPGLAATFPWLSPIAQQYDQWTPNGIIFEFKSTSSEYVATQALGSVIMASEYDMLDEPYSSKIEMLNSAYSNEAKPSQHILHGLECDPRDNPEYIYYTRQNDDFKGDIRDYDLCRFTVATQGGSTADLNLGSLYVHYDITFRKEQLSTGLLLRNQIVTQYKLSPTDRSELFANRTLVGGVDPGFEFSQNYLTFPDFTNGMHWLILWSGFSLTTSTGFQNLPKIDFDSSNGFVDLEAQSPGPFPQPDAKDTSHYIYGTKGHYVSQVAPAGYLCFDTVELVNPSNIGVYLITVIQINADVSFGSAFPIS